MQNFTKCGPYSKLVRGSVNRHKLQLNENEMEAQALVHNISVTPPLGLRTLYSEYQSWGFNFVAILILRLLKNSFLSVISHSALKYIYTFESSLILL